MSLHALCVELTPQSHRTETLHSFFYQADMASLFNEAKWAKSSVHVWIC